MQINVPNFGFKTGEVAPRPSVGPETFITPGIEEMAQGGLKLGEVGAEIAGHQAREEYLVKRQEQIQNKQIENEAKRAEAMTIHATAHNALNDAHDQLVNGIQDGTVNKDAAAGLWAKTSQSIVDENLKQVDQANYAGVKAALIGPVGDLGRSVNQAVVNRNRQDIGAGLDDYLEQMQRLGVTDVTAAKNQANMAIDSLGPQRGWNPDQIGKAKQTFSELVTFNAASSFITKNQNDPKALDQFLKALPAASDLDPGKKNILEGKAMSYITHLENKALAAENRRLNDLNRAGTKLDNLMTMGVPIQDQDLLAYQTAAKDTPYQAHADSLVQGQQQIQELLRKSPSEQAAFVSGLEQNLMTNGVGDPHQIARLRQTVNSTIKLISDNPLQYANDRSGANVQPLDLTNPDSWSANLANRTSVLTALSKQTGTTPKALFPQEATALSNILDKGTPEQKKSYLETLRKGLADDTVFRATMQQIAPDSPVTALAAVIATKETPLTYGRIFKDSYTPGSTSALMLQGENILNPPKGQKAEDGKGKGFQMPSGPDDKTMRQHFSDAVGEVFTGAPQAYDTQLQAARSVYSALSVNAGDYSGQLNSSRWAEAINRTMPIGKYNGNPILKPWGMDDSRFKDRVQAAFPAALKAAGLPEPVITKVGFEYRFPYYQLQNLNSNQYLVKSGTDYLTGPKGKVVITVPDDPGHFINERGNIVAQIPGEASNERMITVENKNLNKGQPTNIPTIWNGQQLSEQEAIDRAFKSGQKYDAFSSVGEAIKAAKATAQGRKRQNLQVANP